MRTRTLLILAAACGLLILLAGGVKLLQVATDPAEVDALDVGEATTIGDMTATVLAIDARDDATVVTVQLSGVPGEAADDGWRLWADGSTRPYEPVASADDDTCADAVVPDTGAIRCDLVFAAVDTVQGVIYVRAGDQRQWAPS